MWRGWSCNEGSFSIFYNKQNKIDGDECAFSFSLQSVCAMSFGLSFELRQHGRGAQLLHLLRQFWHRLVGASVKINVSRTLKRFLRNRKTLGQKLHGKTTVCQTWQEKCRAFGGEAREVWDPVTTNCVDWQHEISNINRYTHTQQKRYQLLASSRWMLVAIGLQKSSGQEKYFTRPSSCSH